MGIKDHDKYFSGLNGAGYPNQVSSNMQTGERSLRSVVMQSGKPVLDSELNLGQSIADYTRGLLMDAMTPSGFVRGVTQIDGYNDYTFPISTDPSFVANSFYMAKKQAIVAGFPVDIEFTNIDTAGTNLITLSAPDAPGAPPTYQRIDFVFLEVWQALVAPSPRASATCLVNADPSDLDTITVDATVLTAKLVPVVATDFLITVGNTVATAAALAACINLNLATVTADAGGTDTVTIKAAVRGAAGNGIVVASAAAAFTISGNTAGGADRLNKPTQETVYRHGNVLSSTTVALAEELTDSTIDVETAQRVQIQYRIRATNAVEGVSQDVFPDGFSAQGGTGNGPEAMGAKTAIQAGYYFVPADGSTVRGSSDASAYGRLDNGLWIAGDGTNASAVALGSLDGYVYAIPIAMVFRRNLDYFDPVNNTNGGYAYNHAVVPAHPYFGVAIPANLSDRIDGAFADAINANDILDLRRSIIPAGTNLSAELKFQMQSLMDGNYRSWAIDGGDKQTLGNGSGDISTRHLVCNEVGRSTALGGVANSSGTTVRGEFIRNFDHVARRFGDQPVTERVVAAFYPGDRTVAGALGLAFSYPIAASPLTLTTATPHGLAIGDLITITGTADINGNYAVLGPATIPVGAVTLLTFQIAALSLVGGAGVISSNDLGEDNNGKYVTKAASPVGQFHWVEGDVLNLDLANLNVNTTGEMFEGTAVTTGGPALSFTQCAPPGTVITDVISVFHDDGNYDGAAGAMDQQAYPTTILGLGTDHVSLTLDMNRELATGGLAAATLPQYRVVQSGMAIASSDTSNPVVITTVEPHGLTSLDLVDFVGAANANLNAPASSGTWVATVTAPTTFTVPYDASLDAIGGAVGTVTKHDDGSRRRVFVEFEVTYPMGSGLTDTPDLEIVPESTIPIFAYGYADGRNAAIVENDTTQRPADIVAPIGQLLREGYREVGLDYAAQTAAGAIITDQIVSRDVAELVYPRRVYGSRTYVPALYSVTEVPTAVVKTIDSTNSEFGSSSRRILLDAGTLLAQEQALCTVLYYAQDAVPNYGAIGYQISSYFRSNAPQTAGTKEGEISNASSVGTMPQTLTVEPLIMADGLWTGQIGMGSVEEGFPYAAPLDQLPINDGGTTYSPVGNGTREEWYFCGSSSASVADFDANTGLLNLHAFVPGDITGTYTIGGATASQRPRKDTEFRAFYPYMDTASYRPTILAQKASGIIRHKVFIPCLARATADAVGAAPNYGILYRKGELLLLVFVRSAELDADNTIRFLDPTGNRTAVAVYRTRNMLLLAGE
jgi:hypothetical protein